ncbi:MAG TPA: neutral/alkaline non-lysosomal ceramidase N-terminal domain-containing protein [Candidatus Dormibacteraeota bacterium]|nr:neutral/alkaline non-lysosomal ceramidase N-terminal domain-containing protein [Candidatus Dormibacteraeota bacterium]
MFRLHLSISFAWLAAILLSANCLSAKEALVEVGVAKVDITPDYPIRLCGYAARKKESEGVAQRLSAKALAIGSDREKPAILLTVDNTGVPASIRNEVVARLQKKKGLLPERIALCSSHSHTAPCLAENLPTLFGEPLPPEHQAHIDRYTRELVDALERVALDALKARKPSRLFWAQGQAEFAANRRTKGGPVDHALPVLVVMDAKDNLRAVLANYACHCTTLGPETNLICGDWAGYAQDHFERDHPGALFMVAIGCGADANPQPRTGLTFAEQHGREIETSVNLLLSRSLTPLKGKINCRAKLIQLPFDKARTRDEWEVLAKQGGAAGYYAHANLAKLDRGEQLPTTLPCQVQAWNFGNDLSMVFLAGEVVVDYSLRLKKEFDPSRLWLNAYANDVPCYIPSERILKEGGYEGGGAMMYYDKPNRLAPGVENLIVGAVHDLVPASFISDEQKAEFPAPKSPEESLRSIQTKPGLEVQLAAAEPLVVDPVAIDWGADGKLWVVEMRDYPMGMDGHWKPGSRIKFLEDTNGDGRYDKATILLDNLPFSTGVTAWGKGVLVCAAPDILYAEPAGGVNDRRVKNPIVKKILTGFATDNYQARVNSLSLGLDNWIYGANGLLGGIIRGTAQAIQPTQPGVPPSEVDIRGRDFRLDPITGVFEPASGLTQQGRCRDDWGNWFGCDNSVLMWQYPLPDQYIRRNPYVAAPSPRVSIAAGEDPNLLHPTSRMLERFNQPQAAGRVTSACGLGIYRDVLLGDDFGGNAFICEPVHNLVHRLLLKPNGVTLTGVRAQDEEQSEFLASRDNWFRPVQARTGPDGALWVVDMYRFVIEHPRWIPPERLARLDPRAGDDKGRIYRVVAKGKSLRPIRNLTKLSDVELAEALDTANGTERDRIQEELVFNRGRKGSGPSPLDGMGRGRPEAALAKLAVESKDPAVRLQALSVLHGLNALPSGLIIHALGDTHPAVRANAIQMAEHRDGIDIAKLADDPNLSVRFQLALSLGESKAPDTADALAKLASSKDLADSWMRSAIISSAGTAPAQLLSAVLKLDPKTSGRSQMVNNLIATAAGEGEPATLGAVISAIIPTGQKHELWQLTAVNSLLDALERKQFNLDSVAADKDKLKSLFDWARKLALASETSDSVREAAIHLLGRQPARQEDDLRALQQILDGPVSARAQTAVFAALKRIRRPEVSAALLDKWSTKPPSLRQASLEVLLSRDEWIANLLSALESGTVAANEIAPAERQRLLKHRDVALRKRAEGLWNGSHAGSRVEILARYQPVTTMPGDASRGGTVFANTCATCHFLRGQGHSVGPNLAALADKTPGDFLTAILDPNAAVEPRFIAYNIETKDGRSLSGIVSAETATGLTLVQGGGAQEQLLRTEIQSIRASGLSLMPEGLEQNLSQQNLADLIAYLKTTPRPFGSATPEQAEEAKKKFLAYGMTGFGKLVSAFDQLPYGSWMGTLPLAYCRQTDGKSKLVWQTASAPDVRSNAPAMFRLPIGMGFHSEPKGDFQLSLNGKPALHFDVSRNDASWQSSDGKIKMSYTVLENNGQDSNGVLLLEVDSSLLEPGKPATFEVLGSAANSQRWFGIYLISGSGSKT